MLLNFKRWHWGLVYLVLAGLFIRVLPTLLGFVHFSFDQGLDILMIKQLVVDHSFNLISRYSGLQGVLMGPLWTWFLAVPFVLFKGDPTGSVFFLESISVLSSIMTFFLLRRIIGGLSATVIFSVTLFSPAFIQNSRVVLSPHLTLYLFIFYIYCLHEIFARDKQIFFLPLFLLIGIFFQLEIAFAAFTIPAVFFTALLFRKLKQTRLLFLLGGIIVLFFTFIPQVLFDLRHDFLISRSLFQFLTGSSQGLYENYLPLSVRVWERMISFWQDLNEMALFAHVWPLKVILLSLAVLGWLVAIRKNLRQHLSFLKIGIAILLSFFIGFSIYKGPIWSWYRAGLPIVYVLLIFLPLGILMSKNRVTRVVIAIFLAIVVFQGINPFLLSKDLSSSYRGGADLGAQKEILDYVYSSAKDRPFSYYVYTPPVYDYIWQYDFWWYGKAKFGYLPRNFSSSIPLLGIGEQAKPPDQQQGLFYLIIEPNEKEPWAANGWKETFIKVGKVKKSKTFPSGIIVEERIAT